MQKCYYKKKRIILKLKILQYLQYFLQLYLHSLLKLLPFVSSIIVTTFIQMSNDLHQILQENFHLQLATT